METQKNLLKELSELLNLVESFKEELSKISAHKRGFEAVSNHIDTAISESEEATKKLIDIIGKTYESLQDIANSLKDKSPEDAKKLSEILNNLTTALTFLEFQDILAQRLLKVKTFVSELEKSILRVALLAGIEEAREEEKEELQKKLEELEWKKEVSQSEVDEIMKQFGL